MFHIITFKEKLVLDLEISRKHRVEQVQVKPGEKRCAQLKPYVIETNQGPVEVADLFFDDGTATRTIPYAMFAMLD